MSPAADAIQEAHNYLVNIVYEDYNAMWLAGSTRPPFLNKAHASGRGWVK